MPAMREDSVAFQFHKVRLKAYSRRVRYIGSQFQFHKVRLKASYVMEYIKKIMFQFHKVRLKGIFGGIKSAKAASFNSIRYD